MLAEAERSYFQKRAKCAYLTQSDRCSKFFHNLIKRNNKRNTIVAIPKGTGENTTSVQKVTAEFVFHFCNLMGAAAEC